MPFCLIVSDKNLIIYLIWSSKFSLSGPNLERLQNECVTLCFSFFKKLKATGNHYWVGTAEMMILIMRLSLWKVREARKLGRINPGTGNSTKISGREINHFYFKIPCLLSLVSSCPFNSPKNKRYSELNSSWGQEWVGDGIKSFLLYKSKENS